MPLSLRIENATERIRTGQPAICAGCGAVILPGSPYTEVWAILDPDVRVNILPLCHSCRGPDHNRLVGKIFEHAVHQLEHQPPSLLTSFERALAVALSAIAPQPPTPPCS